MCLRLRMLKDLKKFIIAPLERGVTADEPIEYLTEIRQVTILFINCKIKFTARMTAAEVIDIADKAFLTVNRFKKKCVILFQIMLNILDWLKKSSAA